ncbi:hypothetical protein Pst134EA_015140 [Puccinia striiformis f. sp. tritici]|uniref:hypothetical protein n=1 Tax=Puccinia striiformis f. sp. tritici TaxID=168172 RepID=UPI002008B3D1|nr:hypothetical protein Pst134EA_015140 [Puccinia striiformis f. sp. tritici]KAH9452319.1 hypothetical protein Pst134EB_016277 [Puccinia striiformis f. sp. tritici]KAH9463053.1 hypothetical protein Pst134EA_015140 [Puccinia striiformis f. sp. tritici]
MLLSLFNSPVEHHLRTRKEPVRVKENVTESEAVRFVTFRRHNSKIQLARLYSNRVSMTLNHNQVLSK